MVGTRSRTVLVDAITKRLVGVKTSPVRWVRSKKGKLTVWTARGAGEIEAMIVTTDGKRFSGYLRRGPHLSWEHVDTRPWTSRRAAEVRMERQLVYEASRFERAERWY